MEMRCLSPSWLQGAKSSSDVQTLALHSALPQTNHVSLLKTMAIKVSFSYIQLQNIGLERKSEELMVLLGSRKHIKHA